MSVQDTFGKWPGDETDAEIVAALSQIDQGTARLIRYCPECGHTGPIDNTKHISCCPDGNQFAVDVPASLVKDRDQLAKDNADLRTLLFDRENRVSRLERFICHSGGLVNEWAKSCPFGTKLTDHIKSELNDYLKRNP